VLPWEELVNRRTSRWRKELMPARRCRVEDTIRMKPGREAPIRHIVCGMVLFDSLLAWLVSVVGVATGAAYIPQALRIWKRKSSDDVSILTYLLFLGGQIVYLVYGIRIRQWPLIIGMAANIVGSLAVILSALRFRAGRRGPQA